MNELKDWTKQIEGLTMMDGPEVTNLYTDILATAHDIGYKVPDEHLIETEDPDELRKVIVPLHEGLKSFHAEQAKAKPAKEKVVTPKRDTAKKAVPKKPARKAAQKDVSKENAMSTATATKKASAAAPKKAAKSAKKAAPKKGAAKKAAASNARTGVGVSRFTGDEVITVKAKTNPAREGSAKFERMANLMKHNGKKVKDFLKTKLGRSSTLHNASKAGYISIK